MAENKNFLSVILKGGKKVLEGISKGDIGRITERKDFDRSRFSEKALKQYDERLQKKELELRFKRRVAVMEKKLGVGPVQKKVKWSEKIKERQLESLRRKKSRLEAMKLKIEDIKARKKLQEMQRTSSPGFGSQSIIGIKNGIKNKTF